jgi:hypothetical protein
MITRLSMIVLVIYATLSAHAKITITCKPWSAPRDNVLVNGQRVRGRFRECFNSDTGRKYIETEAAIIFTAGVGIDGGINPRYSLIPSHIGEHTLFVVGEDVTARGTTTFNFAAHLDVDRARDATVRWLPIGLGVGFAPGIGPRMTVGSSLQLRDRWIITPSLALSSVTTLPMGLSVGGITDDPKALTRMSHRYQTTWALVVSYNFALRSLRTYTLPTDDRY